jgi:hypothetical protein
MEKFRHFTTSVNLNKMATTRRHVVIANSFYLFYQKNTKNYKCVHFFQKENRNYIFVGMAKWRATMFIAIKTSFIFEIERQIGLLLDNNAIKGLSHVVQRCVERKTSLQQ